MNRINKVEKILHQRDKFTGMTGACFALCGGKKKSLAPHSIVPRSSQCLKPFCSQNGHTTLAWCLGYCPAVVCPSLLTVTGNCHPMPHRQSVSFIHAKGTSSPFSRKVTSFGLAFGHRRAIFITRKPNSYHPKGWHDIPFLTLHMGQNNSRLFYTKHSNSEQQITP